MHLLLPLLLLTPLHGGSGADPLEHAEGALENDLAAWSIQNIDLPAEAGLPFTARVRLDDWYDAELVLVPYGLRDPGFQVIEVGDDGPKRVQAPPPKTYRGEIAGLPGTRVAATLDDGGHLTAWIDPNDGSGIINVQPLRDFDADAVDGLHVIYRGRDLLPDPAGRSCGVPDPPRHEEPASAGSGAGAGQGSGQNHGHDHAGASGQGTGSGNSRAFVSVRIAFDADWDFYKKNGSNTSNTVSDVESILNAMDAIYQSEVEICYRNIAIIVRTSSAADPYTTSDPGNLLDEFRIHWNTNHQDIPRDIAHLMTGRNLSGSTIGIAEISSICKTNGYALSESRYTSNFNRRVSLTTHELGHNWSAQHCCGGCSGCSSCHIMCPCNGGCSGNVTIFGSQTRGKINNFKNNGTPCKTDGCGEPATVHITDPFPGSAGSVNSLDLKDGSSNGTAELYYSLNSGSFSVPGCAGLTLDLAQPKSGGTFALDQYGSGTFSKNVPWGALGKTFYIQCVDVTGCKVSNVVIRTF